MAKDLNIAILIDFYGKMLTDKRYEVLDMYYNQDLSLAEIADEIGISRQGVRDAIKHGEKQLGELEEKLGLVERFMMIKSRIKQINKIFENDGLENMDAVKKILKEIDEAV